MRRSPMRWRSISERRATLHEDPHLRELFSAHPELAEVAEAFLWAYPHSPRRSRLRLALVGVLGVGVVIGVVGWHRRLR